MLIALGDRISNDGEREESLFPAPMLYFVGPMDEWEQSKLLPRLDAAFASSTSVLVRVFATPYSPWLASRDAIREMLPH